MLQSDGLARILRVFLCFLLFSGIAVSAAAAETDPKARGIDVSPDDEKRSCIQSVDGYAYLSEDKTLSETRAAAFANAKRQAVEMARTYIQSKTHVEDFELKSDTISASSEGAVTILEQKDLGVEDNQRYHVWIKAEVEYRLKPAQSPQNAAPPAAAQAPQTAGPLTVRVWTDKKEYREGESIEIFLQGNRDFYARIVDVTASGEIIQLLPNAYREINRFEGGKVYKIPDGADRFNLRVSPPFGQDQIVVYASEAPLGKVNMENVGQGLGMYRGSREALGVRTRGISVVGSSPSASETAEFYEATWALFTKP